MRTYQGRLVHQVSDYPELAATWNHEKNTGVSIDDYKWVSKEPVWWKCPVCNHEWKSIPRSRVNPNGKGGIAGCPACCGKELNSFDRRNSFGKVHPEHVEFWDYEKNGDIGPYDILAGTTKKFWFKCKICGESMHVSPIVFEALQGCAKCKDTIGTSTGERILYRLIENHFPDAIEGDRKLLDGYEIDIVIPSISICIEYDGTYFHHNADKMKAKYDKIHALGFVLFRVCEGMLTEEYDGAKYADEIFHVGYGIVNHKRVKECFERVLARLGCHCDVDIDRLISEDISSRKFRVKPNAAINDELLMRYWHPTKNVVDPRFVNKNSRTVKCWFICPRCGRDWYAYPGHLHDNGGCRKCNRVKLRRKLLQREIKDGKVVEMVWNSVHEAAEKLHLNKGSLTLAAGGRIFKSVKNVHTLYGCEWYWIEDDAK